MLVHVGIRALGLLVLLAEAARRGESAERALTGWDAGWYRGIAAHGYGACRSVPDGRTLCDYAFFPLFPALERAVAELAGVRVLDAGLLVSGVSSIVAAIGIFAVGSHVADSRTGVLLVTLWSAAPISIVTSMAYAESLFTALVAWSLYLVLVRRYLPASLLCLLAGLTRPTGGALALALLVAVWVSWREGFLPSGAGARSPRGVLMSSVVLAPLGTLSFLLYVGVREREPLAYFAIARGWGNGFDGGHDFLLWIWQLLAGGDPVGAALVLVGLALLMGNLWLLVRHRYPAALVVFTLVSAAIALTTSGYFGSKPRYLLPVFPLLLPLAGYLSRRSTRLVVTALSVLAVASGVFGALWLLGPGPP